MARRPNYGAEKRSKELDKLRKREEKAEKKRVRREAAASPLEVTSDGEMEATGLMHAPEQAEGDTEDDVGGE
jgi:hypothetical protein